MPEFCTCGAQLPPDARFCHKCAKPQYDYPGFEVEAPVAPPPLPVTPAVAPKPEISFHNRVAVRIGFLVALMAFLPFLVLSLIPIFPPVVAFLMGFLAVFSYSKLTGQPLSVRNGARMGWITGVFSFGITAVFLILTLALLASQGRNLADQMRQYPNPFVHPSADQIAMMTKVLQDPATLVLFTAIWLIFLFVILTALPAMGGALGAKVLTKE